ncbi:MAG: chemotaxis protein CheW [Desulfobacteraceae bacterium]|nr:chemotaxis protein CheW [Desulfobacteraceae bacterium]
MALIFDQEDILQLVGFKVGSKLFGANILTVREILRDPVINSVGNVPSFVEGIIRLRGEVLPIIDLGRLLGVTVLAQRERIWALVAQAGKKRVGYIVDGVTPIIRVKTNAVFPAPDIIMQGLRSKYISGVCETDKGLLVVVELDRILLDDEVNAMNKLAIS